MTDQQAVRRPQRRRVEFDGPVLRSFIVEGIGFQIAQVRCHHRAAADAVQFIEDRSTQRCSLGRIGAGAQFIEQDQAFVVGGSQDVGNAGDVRAEGAERLFQTLFIANVGEDVREHRHAAAFAGRDVHSALGHQTEQTGRFQCDRFAAGVRSSDDEQIEAVAETDIDGDHFSLGGGWRVEGGG